MTQPVTKTRAQIFAELANPPETRWRYDPGAWASERAGIELWSKQRAIIESVRDNRKTAVASCHEIGKSFTAAVTVAWWLDTHLPGEAFVVTTAPTAPQVKAILWREINRIHERAGLKGRTNLTEWYIGSELVAFGRKPSDYSESAFQGIHARFVLVVLDEACGIPKKLWDSASSLAANEHSRMLAIGNPDDPVGEFASVCAPGSGWNSMHVGYADTPNFTGEKVSQLVADSLIHPAWVDDRRSYWGEESALFQSKCLGKFPTVGDPWQLIPISWANQCRWLDFPSGKKPVEAGIDVGAGNDRTVVTVREGNSVKNVKWFINPDPVQTTGLIALHLKENDVTCAKVDTIGVGWGIYGMLRDMSSKNNPLGAGVHNADVVPINVGAAPTEGNEERFLNRRAQLWWDIGRENCRLKLWDFSRLPENMQNDLIHELTLPKYQILDAKGRIKVEPKEETKKRLGGASPDLADSLLLAFVPANWTAVTIGASVMMQAPSFTFSASDMLGRRGW